MKYLRHMSLAVLAIGIWFLFAGVATIVEGFL